MTIEVSNESGVDVAKPNSSVSHGLSSPRWNVNPAAELSMLLLGHRGDGRPAHAVDGSAWTDRRDELPDGRARAGWPP